MDLQNEQLKWMEQQMWAEQQTKLERYRILNRYATPGEILFTGSSLMEQFPINELLMSNKMTQIIYNRGIGGFTTDDMLQYMDEMVYGTRPSKIFINIGTNDISKPQYRLETLIGNYRTILCRTKEQLPQAEIFMMAYYPVNETDKLPDIPGATGMFATRNNENLRTANQAVEALAAELECRYIDVNRGLTDDRGKLKKEYTIEGIHMYANAYQIILENMKPYL